VTTTPPTDTDQPTTQPTAIDRFARLATEIFAPWVWLVVLPFVVAWAATGRWGGTALWGALVALFGSLIPMYVIVRGARRGRWDGHHVNNREGRLIPLATCILSLAVGIAILLIGNAPHQMLALAGGLMAILVITTAITVIAKWKISLHGAVAAGTVAILTLAVTPWLALATLAVVWVGWSRVHLRDHTALQVILGAITGVIAGGSLYWTLDALLR
jgi:hypothetical protein